MVADRYKAVLFKHFFVPVKFFSAFDFNVVANFDERHRDKIENYTVEKLRDFKSNFFKRVVIITVKFNLPRLIDVNNLLVRLFRINVFNFRNIHNKTRPVSSISCKGAEQTPDRQSVKIISFLRRLKARRSLLLPRFRHFLLRLFR